MVKDIWPGIQGSTPAQLTNVNGSLFFTAEDGVHGREVWQSNGTAAGTMLVKAISPSFHGAYPLYLTNANGTLFFSANDGVHGAEPWILGPVPPLVHAAGVPMAGPPSALPGTLNAVTQPKRTLQQEYPNAVVLDQMFSAETGARELTPLASTLRGVKRTLRDAAEPWIEVDPLTPAQQE